MKNIVTSTSDFEKLIESKALYVDKTDYLFSLISKAPGMFFSSRPRRFGKTLTLYTLEAIFKGKKNYSKA
ncbi:MAG: AAA family ATPase [Candidatus Ornithospirochaeta sp.]